MGDVCPRLVSDSELSCAQALLATVPDTILRLTADGVVRAHKAGGDLLPESPVNVIGRELAELLPSEVAQSLNSAITRVLKTRAAEESEHQLRQDGTLRYFRIRVMAVGCDEALLVAHDVTRRRRTEDELHRYRHQLEELVSRRTGELADLNQRLRAELVERQRIEEALRESERLFRTLAETTPTGIFIAQGEHLRYVNPAMAGILGHSVEALVGRRYSDFVHAEMHALVEKRYAARLAGQAVPSRYELRVVDRNGDDHWLDFAAALIEYEGQPAILGTALDITDRKLAQQEARRHLDELAHVTRLSTMGEMASSLAHEVNQPLSATANYVGAAIRRARAGNVDTHELLDDLQAAILQIRRAGDVVRHIKNFIRKREPDHSPCHLNHTIRHTVALVEDQLRQHKTAVDLDLADNLPRALMDEIQIQQVVLNLARNGIEALAELPADSQRRISIQTTPADARWIRVSISDNGPVVPAGKLDRIFDAFFTTKPSGMGLGLSISRSIVESHGGRLTATANPHGGLTFSFTLPVYDEEARDEC